MRRTEAGRKYMTDSRVEYGKIKAMADDLLKKVKALGTLKLTQEP